MPTRPVPNACRAVVTIPARYAPTATHPPKKIRPPGRATPQGSRTLLYSAPEFSDLAGTWRVALRQRVGLLSPVVLFYNVFRSCAGWAPVRGRRGGGTFSSRASHHRISPTPVGLAARSYRRERLVLVRGVLAGCTADGARRGVSGARDGPDRCPPGVWVGRLFGGAPCQPSAITPPPMSRCLPASPQWMTGSLMILSGIGSFWRQPHSSPTTNSKSRLVLTGG
jgi:hypothetical protein